MIHVIFDIFFVAVYVNFVTTYIDSCILCACLNMYVAMIHVIFDISSLSSMLILWPHTTRCFHLYMVESAYITMMNHTISIMSSQQMMVHRGRDRTEVKGQKPRMVDIGPVKWHFFKMNAETCFTPKKCPSGIEVYRVWSNYIDNLTKYSGILTPGNMPESRKRTAFVKISSYFVKIRCGRMRWSK